MLAADVFADVLDAFAFIGFGGVVAADAGGGETDDFFVDAFDGDEDAVFADGGFDAFGEFVLFGGGEA